MNDLKRASELIGIVRDGLSKGQLYLYNPYPKQRQFHNTLAKERCLIAGNQVGKTWCAGAETAYHLTNDYPKWWQGKRFQGGIKVWASGVTSLSTRDNPQRILLGQPHQMGSGMIPGNLIDNVVKAHHGCANSVDYVQIVVNSPHTDIQGTSYVYFKSYEQGREKWQGESINLVWFDEEPPATIYSEGLTRTAATKGIVYLTFTPLLGMSEVVRGFRLQGNEDKVTIKMGIYDAGHYSREEADAQIARYPEHERQARAFGEPILGSGAVFPVLEAGIRVDPFEIPDHWPRIAGLDIGWDHPTAVVWITLNPDSDTIYVYDTYRESRRIISHHASAIKARGSWIPLAWPHDGMETDPGSGESIIGLYRREGVKALNECARFPDSRGNSLEARVAEILDRMETNRFKVFSHLADWFEEYRMYHRDQGKIVKEYDDLMSATQYATMMLKSARRVPDYTGGWHRYEINPYAHRTFMSN